MQYGIGPTADQKTKRRQEYMVVIPFHSFIQILTVETLLDYRDETS